MTGFGIRAVDASGSVTRVLGTVYKICGFYLRLHIVSKNVTYRIYCHLYRDAGCVHSAMTSGRYGNLYPLSFQRNISVAVIHLYYNNMAKYEINLKQDATS
jgi:hypothetical protein